MSTWLLSFFWLLPFTEGGDDRAVAVKALESIIAAYDKAGSYSFNARYSQKFFDLDTHYVVTARVEGNTDAVFMAADARKWMTIKGQLEVIYSFDTTYHINRDRRTISRWIKYVDGNDTWTDPADPKPFVIPMISNTFNVGQADLMRCIKSMKRAGVRVVLDYQRGDSMAFTVWYPEWVSSLAHRSYYINTRVPCVTAIRDTSVMDGKQQIMSTTIESFRFSEKPFSVKEKLQRLSRAGYRKVHD